MVKAFSTHGPVLDLGPGAPTPTHLASLCQAQALPIGDNTPESWAQAWQKSPPLLIVLDDWQRWETQPEIHRFWQQLLHTAPHHVRFAIGSTPDCTLPIAGPVAQGHLHVLTPSDLRLSPTEASAYWQTQGLSWQDSDQHFWEQSGGWPLALGLWCQHRQGALSAASFDLLLRQAVHELLAPLLLSDQAPARERMQAWGLALHQWPALWQTLGLQLFGEHPALWLLLAVHAPDLHTTHLYLERAERLAQGHYPGLLLATLTRRAHAAALQGQTLLLDQCLNLGEQVLAQGQPVDQAAWYYQRANRARQGNDYPAVNRCLQALAKLSADRVVLQFQTRGRVLQGLSAYQTGDYTTTRSCYEAALSLSQIDGNQQLELEIRIMLAFLDTLEGHAEELPSNIMAQIEAMPLSAQPMMWLNLTFFWILGEKPHVGQAETILAKVRETTHMLGWDSFKPLIADVEARLWRFRQDYERARQLHQEAQQQLEPHTFEHLYATLNWALTCLRQRDPAAEELLKTVITRAETAGTQGVLREARAALQALSPSENQPVRQQPLLDTRTAPLLTIQTFGAFHLERNGVPILKWPRKKARHILLHLLFHPHGIHRETLADRIAGSDDLDLALRNLDVHIHSLRKLLEPERKGKSASTYIQFYDASYSFNWNCPYQWDAETLQQCWNEWLQLRDTNPEAAYQAAQKALHIYRGPLLPELDFADDWIPEREGYERKAVDLVQWCVPWLVEHQQPEQAEELVEQVLSRDPCHEQAWGWLIELSSRRGGQRPLERTLERMEEAFERELGLPVPDALFKLAHRLQK